MTIKPICFFNFWFYLILPQCEYVIPISNVLLYFVNKINALKIGLKMYWNHPSLKTDINVDIHLILYLYMRVCVKVFNFTKINNYEKQEPSFSFFRRIFPAYLKYSDQSLRETIKKWHMEHDWSLPMGFALCLDIYRIERAVHPIKLRP